MIGIPLAMREEGSFKPILSLIHDLELSKTKGSVESLKDLPLPDVHPAFGQGVLVPAPETEMPHPVDITQGTQMDSGATIIVSNEGECSLSSQPSDPTAMYNAEADVLLSTLEDLITNTN
jgi:hypothetical protein